MTDTPVPGVRIGRPRRLLVDVRAALGLTGTLLKYLALSCLFPVAFALGYGEPIWPFLASGAIAAGAGLALERVGRGTGTTAGFREGYLVVALAWLLAGTYGALPYLLSGEPQLDRPVDALFEAMSGFTTTGASLLVDVEGLNHSLAMWRQFTQWLGGLGIVVLVLAVLPRLRVGGRQLLESELPGPEVDQLGVRIKETVKRLWIVYVGLTAAETMILCVVGWAGLDDRMSPYEALAHALTTIPTGGFSTQARSLEEFSAVTQWVVVVFMVLAALNFALLWLAVVGRPGRLLRDEEARLFAVLLVVASSALALELATNDVEGHGAPVRNGVFQAVSLMTGTGYATLDFADWTALGLMSAILLMFIGGSAGSTTGSVKVLRHLLLGKVLRRELQQTLHPELVLPVHLNGSPIDEKTLRAAISFVALYLAFFVVGSGIIAVDASLQGPDLTPVDAISAGAATLGNVGPALGPAGPMDSYAPFSDLSTTVMIVLMWLGRIELLPVVVLLTRRYWRP